MPEDLPAGFVAGPPTIPLVSALYWRMRLGYIHLWRVAIAGNGKLVARELDLGSGFAPLEANSWDAHAPCSPPGCSIVYQEEMLSTCKHIGHRLLFSSPEVATSADPLA